MADDVERPEPPEPPDRRSSALGSPTTYTGWVGLAFVILIVIAIVNGAQTEETGILGVDGPERGWKLREFAAPLATSELDGDANISESACEVELEGSVAVCDLFDEPLVISFWFTQRADCVAGQDVFDDVAAEFSGQANFLSVNIRDDRDKVREIVSERGWSVAVAHDRDGAVSNIYGVGGCPTLAYAFPGGVLMRATIGAEELEAERLRSRVEALLAESRKRDER